MPNFFSRLFFGSGPEQRDSGATTQLSAPAPWLYEAFGAMPTDAGVAVSPDNALKYTVLYACINVLAQTIAQVPWDVYRVDGKARRVARERTEHWLLHSEPSGLMTSYSFRMALLTSILTHGNGYVEIIRDGANRVTALRLLPPRSVAVYESLDRTRLVYQVTRLNGTMDTLDGSDVIHVPYLSFDGIAGLSPIALHRQAIGLGIAAEGASAALLGNGSVPPGYLQTDKGMKREVREDVEKRWFQKVGGWRKKGKVPVLSEGLKYVPIAISPADAQHLETRIYQAAEVARIYRVPAVLVGLADKTSTYASADAFFQSFMTFTIAPLAQSIEQEFDRKLFPHSDDLYCRLDLKGLMRGDPKARAEFYKSLWSVSAFSANNILEWEEMDPVEGGDRHWVQQGFMPLDKVDEIISKQGSTGDPNAQKPKQDPGGDPAARSVHVRWLNDVAERVGKWEKRDRAKLVTQFLPVFTSYAEARGNIAPLVESHAFFDQLAAEFDPADASFAERAITRSERFLQ